MNEEFLLQAFLSIRDGYSVDRVVTDPELNLLFQQKCDQFDAELSPKERNLALLNLRKSGSLAGQPRSRRTSFANEDEYRFASELAVRYLERRDQVSLDQILCDPEKSVEFDELAIALAPGYSSLQYRWAALNLRKARKIPPELGTKLIQRLNLVRVRCTELELNTIPTKQGLYLFLTSIDVKYIGETSNLRKRLGKHLDHSDNRELARWLWDFGQHDLFLEYQVLPAETSVIVRKGMEAELIRSHQPIFNVQRL